jgi:sugar lactone lactonase YvrE
MKEGRPVKFNSDGIALTPDGNWLYYKPTTDDKLYRIETAALRNWSLNDAALEKKVQDLGHFVTTDGMIFDDRGNLYVGDLQRYSIIRIDPSLKLTTLVTDERLIWPDSYSIANGYLYISCSQIHKQPEYNNGVNKRVSPYTVYRLKL